EIAALEEPGDRPDIAELLPVENFHPLLELIGEQASVTIAGAEDVAPALAERVKVRLSSIDQDQAYAFRGQAANVAARGLKEAEPELEKLSRSGYRTVVAFARRGEGERFGYNLGRLKVDWLDDS